VDHAETERHHPDFSFLKTEFWQLSVYTEIISQKTVIFVVTARNRCSFIFPDVRIDWALSTDGAVRNVGLQNIRAVTSNGRISRGVPFSTREGATKYNLPYIYLNKSCSGDGNQFVSK
jgi:hypothetical protein